MAGVPVEGATMASSLATAMFGGCTSGPPSRLHVLHVPNELRAGVEPVPLTNRLSEEHEPKMRTVVDRARKGPMALGLLPLFRTRGRTERRACEGSPRANPTAPSDRSPYPRTRTLRFLPVQTKEKLT